jgi:hypothetical protein
MYITNSNAWTTITKCNGLEFQMMHNDEVSKVRFYDSIKDEEVSVEKLLKAYEEISIKWRFNNG